MKRSILSRLTQANRNDAPPPAATAAERRQCRALFSGRVARAVVEGLGVLGGVVAIGLFAYLLVRYRRDYVPEVDSQGYFLMARSFSQLHWPRWTDDFARFFGHVWVGVGHGQVMAKYPPGWPLILAIGYRLGGLTGALWVNPVVSIVGAVAFFLLAWRLFDSSAACVCTVVWLFSPMVPGYAGYPLSHGADICFVMLAFLFTVCWAQTGSPWFAAPAGFCTGYLPLIRPTDVLIWPAIAVVGWAVAREWRKPAAPPRRNGGRRGLVFVICLAAPLAFLAAYDWVSFGAPWRTGYYLTGEQSGFDFHDWGRRLGVVVAGRRYMLEEKYWLLCLAGFLWWPRRLGLRWGLLLWVVPTMSLYVSYYFFGAAAQYFRFVLACLPAVILGIGFLFPRRGKWVLGVRLLLLLGFAVGLVLSPPRLLVVWARLCHGHEYTLAERGADPAIRLTGLLLGESSPPVFEALRHRLASQPAAVYATGPVGWSAGAWEGVVNYDLMAWRTAHFFLPGTACCSRREVWEDPRRHQWLHDHYAALGREGLWRDMVAHIDADLDDGRAVWVAVEADVRLQDRLRAEARWRVEATADGLWRVRRAGPG